MPRNPIDLPDPNPKTRGLIPGQEFDLALTRQPGSGQPKGWRAGPTLRIYKAISEIFFFDFLILLKLQVSAVFSFFMMKISKMKSKLNTIMKPVIESI